MNNEAMDLLINSLNNVSKALKEYYNALPNYLKFELMHPRKKPRGSIRRARKARGKE